MSDPEVLRFIRETYGRIIEEAAAAHGHRPEVLAGIVMRETRGGLSPLLDRQGPEGRGDRDKNGCFHGHGLCQIDDRSFPEFCRGEDWKDPEKNIGFGAFVLARKRRWLRTAALPEGLVEGELERASIAAYNCGEGNVLKTLRARPRLDLDRFTAGRNYSSEVLRFAGLYRALDA